MERNILVVPDVLDALARDSDNGLLKYQAVFGQDNGAAWDLPTTWNVQRGRPASTTEEWPQGNLH